MRFKTKATKDKVIGMIIVELLILLIFSIPIAVSLSRGDGYILYMGFSVIILAITTLLNLTYIQWAEIYDDRIIIRSPLFIINKVNFLEVREVRATTLPIFTRDKGKLHFVLCDGRRYKGVFSSFNTDNSKRTCVRLLAFKELEDFLLQKGFNIIFMDMNDY